MGISWQRRLLRMIPDLIQGVILSKGFLNARIFQQRSSFWEQVRMLKVGDNHAGDGMFKWSKGYSTSTIYISSLCTWFFPRNSLWVVRKVPEIPCPRSGKQLHHQAWTWVLDSAWRLAQAVAGHSKLQAALSREWETSPSNLVLLSFWGANYESFLQWSKSISSNKMAYSTNQGMNMNEHHPRPFKTPPSPPSLTIYSSRDTEYLLSIGPAPYCH